MYYSVFVCVHQFPLNLSAAFFGLLYLFFGVPFVTEMLLFKEIQLYRDRIVKAWRLIGTKELKLSLVALDSRCSPKSGVGGKYFFQRGMSPYWRALMPYCYFSGITYQESFADKNEVKQLNSLLAKLSGRRIEEFEQTVTLEKFIEDQKR
jgi:hypothetical protein